MGKVQLFRGGAVALLLGLAACDTDDPRINDFPSGTDTGNPSNGGGGEAAAGCEEVDQREVGFDAATGLGFSAADVWALVEGEHSFPIVWSSQGAVTSGALEGSETVMHVRLSRREDRAPRLLDLEPSADETNGNGEIALASAIGGACADVLELDVTVQLSTEDGALDERFDATLRSSDGIGASWRAEIDHDELAGSLEVRMADDVQEGSELQPLSISMTHTSFAIQGSLGASVEGNNGSVAWQGSGVLATWPEAGGCEGGSLPVSADAQVFGFSFDDALVAVAAHYPETLTWQDGTSTGLAFSLEASDDGFACATLQSHAGPRGLRAMVELVWSSEDGVIAGRLPLTLRAEPDEDGALARVAVYRDAYLADTVPPAAFEDTFGVRGVDVSGYDLAGLQLSWEVDVQGQSASGALAVLGGTVDPCVTEPVESEGGGGVPGCRGTDFTEVLQASF